MFEGCGTVLLLLLIPATLIAYFTARDALRRTAALQTELGELRALVEALGREIRRGRRPSAEGGEPLTAREASEPPPVVAPVPAAPPPTPPVTPPVAPPVTPVSAAPPVAPPVTPPVAPPVTPPVTPRVTPPVTPPVPPPVTTPPPVAPPRPPFDWESLIGVKLFSWIAGIALVLAGVFFLRYSIDHGWLTPPIRMAMGLGVGTGLVVICSLRVAGRYRVTANALDGAGIAILYATIWASHSLWGLIGGGTGFVAMVIVTAVAVVLSIRRDSFFIALLGLVGGFATPALLQTGAARPVPLFGYLLILNAGLAWIAYRKGWPSLTATSLALTAIYQVGWTLRYLDRASVPLAGAVFLAFPALAIGALLLGRRRAEVPTLFERSAGAAALLPLLFAGYTAAVPGFGSRFHLLFAFLLLCDVGLWLIAAWASRGSRAGAVASVATLLVFAVWIGRSWTPAAWPDVLGWIGAYAVGFALLAPWIGRRVPADEDLGRAPLVAALLLGAIPALILLEPRAAVPWGWFLTAAAIVAMLASRRGGGSAWTVGAWLLVGSTAVWNARWLEEARLEGGLLLDLATAGTIVGCGALARRRGAIAADSPATARLLLGSLGLLAFLALGPARAVAVEGLAALAIVGFGAVAWEALRTSRPGVAVAGAGGAFGVLLLWLMATGTAEGLGVLFAATTTLALLALATARVGRDRGVAARFGSSAYAALSAYALLLFAVAVVDVSSKGAAVLGALAVLGLGMGVAALRLGIERLHVLAVAGTYVVLAAWQATEAGEVWMRGIVGAAAVAGGFAAAWIGVAIRSGGRELGVRISLAALVAGFATQWVAAVGAFGGVEPWAIVVLETAAFGGILALAAWSGRPEASVLAVLTAAVATVMVAGALGGEGIDPRAVVLAVLIYAIGTAYPIVLGAAARGSAAPWAVAILASVSMFYVGRQAMLDWGLESAIGILPVAEAVVLLGVLRRAVRLDRSGEAVRGRTAAVAAAMLAFVTVAIPLQLEKEWITVGWALEAAALVWLFRRIPHRGLVWAAAALFAAVWARLVLNPAVLTYHPRAATPILNWFLYTYGVAALAMFAGARWLRGGADPGAAMRKLPAVLEGGATLLLFLLLNIEIADSYATGPFLTFDFFGAPLAQELSYTLGWALFAIAMLIAGIVAGRRGTRIAAIGLLVVTILKCFLHDLAALGGLYRVASFVGLAAALSIVAVLLQRFAIKSAASDEART